MKIVGFSGHNGNEVTRFLVEISAGELCNLVNNSNAHRVARIGSELRVDKMYERLAWLERNSKSVESIVKQLRDTADMLEPMNTFTKFFCEGGK